MDAGGDGAGGSRLAGHWLDLLGVGTALGLNPGELLRADGAERLELVYVLERAAEHRLELDKRLARLIVTELVNAFKRR